MFQNSVEVEVCGLRAKKPGRGANHAVHRLRGSLVQHPLPRGPSKTTGTVWWDRQITRVKLLQCLLERRQLLGPKLLLVIGCVKLGS